MTTDEKDVPVPVVGYRCSWGGVVWFAPLCGGVPPIETHPETMVLFKDVQARELALKERFAREHNELVKKTVALGDELVRAAVLITLLLDATAPRS